jgi:hypothetical protein
MKKNVSLSCVKLLLRVAFLSFVTSCRATVVDDVNVQRILLTT